MRQHPGDYKSGAVVIGISQYVFLLNQHSERLGLDREVDVVTRRCSDRSSALLGGKKTSGLTLEKILEAIPAATSESIGHCPYCHATFPQKIDDSFSRIILAG